MDQNRVVKCKFCYGSGGYLDGLVRKVCPCCGGVGQIELLIPPGGQLVSCNFCYGSGSYLDALVRKPCPTCNGAGVTLPKRVTFADRRMVTTPGEEMRGRPHTFEFDVAISFAGENRDIVREYATALQKQGLKVFYDEFMEAELWGEDLYSRLDDIYRNKARYCVLFISVQYARKLWTNHERKSAQARVFRENKPYLLPVKLDDTTIPDLTETVGYIDLRKQSLEQLVSLTLKKVRG